MTFKVNTWESLYSPIIDLFLVETITAPYSPSCGYGMVMLCQLMIVMDVKGKREIKEAAKTIFPNKDTIVEYFALSQT